MAVNYLVGDQRERKECIQLTNIGPTQISAVDVLLRASRSAVPLADGDVARVLSFFVRTSSNLVVRVREYQMGEMGEMILTWSITQRLQGK